MEDLTLIQLWKSYNQQMEENLQLNKSNAAEILKIKVKSAIVSMKPIKLFTVLVGIVWVFFVDSVLFTTFDYVNTFFLVSAITQVVLTKLAIGIYLYQLALIDKVDVENNIVTVQEKIANLQASSLWVARLMFLQLPVWTTFYWNEEMLSNREYFLHGVQLVVTISFSVISIWLFLNIKMENREKKWFKILFHGKEWDSTIHAMGMLDQINRFKK